MAPDVHRACADDWERVRALRLGALGDAPDAFGSTLAEERDQPEAWWRGRLDNGAVTLIVVVQGRDAGTAVVNRTWDDPAVAGLYSVWVAGWARGRGAGDALMRAAIAAAREGGFTRLVLDVGDHNAAAIALYERHGFLPTGRTSTLPTPRVHVTEHERLRPL